MRRLSLHERLIQVLDRCADEQAAMERAFADCSGASEEIVGLQNDLNALIDDQVKRLIDLIGDDAQAWRYAPEVVTGHRFFQDYLARAGFFRADPTETGESSVDLSMFLIISSAPEQADTAYALALRRFMVGLPGAVALRRSLHGLTAMLESLPSGARVLALDCGPALEVQALVTSRQQAIFLDLFEKDRRILDYLLQHVRCDGLRVVSCNPFELLSGSRQFPILTPESAEAFVRLEPASYDLVYVRSLFNSVSSNIASPSRGVAGLASLLFDLVKPGGRLVIGNYLTPGAANPHDRASQFLLEVFARWHLVYRSAGEIVGFAENLPSYAYHASLLDETLQQQLAPSSVIGFLVLDRIV